MVEISSTTKQLEGLATGDWNRSNSFSTRIKGAFAGLSWSRAKIPWSPHWSKLCLRRNWIRQLDSKTTGNNDILFTYELYRKSNDDIPSYASFLVQIASNLIKELYSLGARKFAAVGVPPLGCVPSERFLYGGIQQDCAASSNEASIQFNNNLIREIGELQTKFFGMKIVYVDLFTPVDHIIGHPTQYGFEEVSNGCCGSGTIETSILCNSLDKHTCKDTSKYVFWDSFHPTQKTFEIVVRGIVKELSHLIWEATLEINLQIIC